MPDRYEQSLRELGLEPGATERAIKDAYRDLVKVWHPDRFGSDGRLREKAQEKLKDLNAAFEQLRGYGGSGFRGSRDPERPVDEASDFRGQRTAVAASKPAKAGRTDNLLILILAAGLTGTIGTVVFMSRSRATQLSPAHDPIGRPAPVDPARVPTSRQPARRGVEQLPSSVTDEAHEPAGAARTGSLSLASRPAGARVSIDGRIIGETPIRVTDVTPGEHHIEVTLEPDAYEPWSIQVIVTAGHEEKVLAVLTPTERMR